MIIVVCYCYGRQIEMQVDPTILIFSYSYDVIADTIRPEEDEITFGDGTTVTGIPTSIVNATAPSPSVILRIVDENGNDISGTRLGQALFIRIELDGVSIFDIFARNLVAKSGNYLRYLILKI
mgnify:FL=1